MRIEGRYGTQIGDVTPHFAIEFGHRLSATSTDPIWYADRPDTIFPILANQIGSQPLTFDFGESLRLRSGFVFDAITSTEICLSVTPLAVTGTNFWMSLGFTVL